MVILTWQAFIYTGVTWYTRQRHINRSIIWCRDENKPNHRNPTLHICIRIFMFLYSTSITVDSYKRLLWILNMCAYIHAYIMWSPGYPCNQYAFTTRMAMHVCRKFLYTNILVCVCTTSAVCMLVCTYRMYVCVSMYVYMYVSMYVCMCFDVCMHMYVYVLVHVWTMHVS